MSMYLYIVNSFALDPKPLDLSLWGLFLNEDFDLS